jgi:hypothetical protein
VAIVNAMSAAEFYETAMRLMVDNPPHFNDQPQLARLGMVGLRAGRGSVSPVWHRPCSRH